MTVLNIKSKSSCIIASRGFKFFVWVESSLYPLHSDIFHACDKVNSFSNGCMHTSIVLNAERPVYACIHRIQEDLQPNQCGDSIAWLPPCFHGLTHYTTASSASRPISTSEETPPDEDDEEQSYPAYRRPFAQEKLEIDVACCFAVFRRF